MGVVRYQECSWLRRRWRDRHLLWIPVDFFLLWWGQRKVDPEEREENYVLWKLAIGFADMRREFWYSWEEVKAKLDRF